MRALVFGLRALLISSRDAVVTNVFLSRHFTGARKMATAGPGLARLDGKVALITGASSGIGAGTAKMFCELGAEVAITGRNAENLQKTADGCGEGKAYCIVGDVTNEEDVQKMVDQTITKYGKLDILVNSAGIVELGTIETTSLRQYDTVMNTNVNNAGIGEQGTIETTSLEQFDRIMNTNVRGMYHITMLAVPHLKKTQGRVVNVSSVNGIRSFPNVLAYNMSKSAVDQFTRCCALELAQYNVRVNSVNPGVIITEIHKRGGLDEDAYQKFLDRTKQTHALGRPGQVPEVAGMIAFLASDNASFITGAQIPIDGGRHAMCPR